MIWYRVGARHEPPGRTGLSHLLEHMMFKGSHRYGKGEIDYITTRHGGFNNAFTSHDYTAYYFSFSSDRWWPALEIESDRMHSATLEEEEFLLEKQVVLEELRMELDSPWGCLRYNLESTVFDRHPYAHPVIGLEKDLVAITRPQLLEHYRRFYCPSNAVLVVVGDFSTDDVLDRVDQLFGRIPAGEPSEMVPPEVNWPADPVRFELKKQAQVSRLLVALPAPSVRQEEFYALQMIDCVLSEGKLSRLYRRLVEEEKVASLVGTDLAETHDPYWFLIRAEVRNGVQVDKVQAMIFEELSELATKPLAAEPMTRARNQALMQFYEDFETGLDQAVQLGLLEILDRFEFWSGFEDHIDRLTAPKVRADACAFLDPQKAAVAVLRERHA